MSTCKSSKNHLSALADQPLTLYQKTGNTYGLMGKAYLCTKKMRFRHWQAHATNRNGHSGARIAIAASGGVDSFLMLKVLTIRKAIMPFPVELMALHINPGFEPNSHAPLVNWCIEHGVPLHVELTDFGPRAHTKENRSNSPCFFCALQRRKRLFELCRDYNLTHLAFGHNADDNVITFFMNIFQNGRADGMAANESFFGGKLQVIRPTMLLDKATVIKAARQWELPVWQNVCPSNGFTKRDDIHEWLKQIWKGDKRIKNNVFNAITRQQVDLTNKKV